MNILWEIDLPPASSRFIHHVDTKGLNVYFSHVWCERKDWSFFSVSLNDGTIRFGDKWRALPSAISSINAAKNEIYVSGSSAWMRSANVFGVFDGSSLKLKKYFDRKIPTSHYIEYDDSDNVLLAHDYSNQITLLNTLDGTVRHRRFIKSVGGILKFDEHSFYIPDPFDGKIYKFDSTTLKASEIFSGEPFSDFQIDGDKFYSLGVYYSYDYEFFSTIWNSWFPRQTAGKRIRKKNGHIFMPFRSREFRITDLTSGNVKTYNVNYVLRSLFYKFLPSGCCYKFKVYKNKCLFSFYNLIHIVELSNFKKIETLKIEKGYEVASVLPELGKILILNPELRRLKAVEFHLS